MPFVINRAHLCSLQKKSCIYDEPFCPQHVCVSLSFVVVFAILSLVRLREECFLFHFFDDQFFVFVFGLMKEAANIYES